MFTRIVVGVDCREGGRDALALARLLRGRPAEASSSRCMPARPRPSCARTLLTRVEGELARAGATGRALVVTDRSPAHALRTIAEARGSRAHRDRVLPPRRRRARPGRRRRSRDAALRALRGGGRRPRIRARARARCGASGVGFDGSEESRIALALACRSRTRRAPAARHHGGGAADPAVAAMAWDPEWSGYDATALEPAERRVLADVAAELDDDVTPEVLVGTPWKELASRSADLDLLVVGARAYGPVRRRCSAARRRGSRATPPVRYWWRRVTPTRPPARRPPRAPPRGAPRPATEHVRCRAASRRSTSATAPTGCARPCSAPTTASCRPPASCSASPRPARRAPRSSPPGSPGWSPARCRWPPASTCRSARSATPSGPTSASRSASCAATRRASCASSPAIYEQRGLPPALATEVARGPVARRRAAGAPARRAGSRRAAARAAASGRLGVGRLVLRGRGTSAAGRRR